jgi:hypothetical protein
MAFLDEGRTYEAGVNLDLALERMRRAGIGIASACAYPLGLPMRWRVQSASDPTQPHVVEAHWDVAWTRAILRCDCKTAWRICCIHRAAVAQLLMVEAGLHGKRDVHVDTCGLCGADYFHAHKSEPDGRAEECWSLSPYAPRSGREVRLALEAQVSQDGRKDAPQGQGSAPVHGEASTERQGAP